MHSRHVAIIIVVLGVEESCDVAGRDEVSAVIEQCLIRHVDVQDQLSVARESILHKKLSRVWAKLILGSHLVKELLLVFVRDIAPGLVDQIYAVHALQRRIRAVDCLSPFVRKECFVVDSDVRGILCA